MGARQCAHFPATGKEIRTIYSVELQHSGQLASPTFNAAGTTPRVRICKRPALVLVPIYFRQFGTKSEMRARALIS
jgi:hypothetical protein